jgi:TPR repeat protein
MNVKRHRIATIAALALPTLCLMGPVLPARAGGQNIEQLSTAAERGDAQAQHDLARALLTGRGVAKDPEKACELMKKSAGQGNADGMGGLGYFYSAGVVVEKDNERAVEWFRKGAEKGSVRAQLNLGLMTANGRGVARDEAEGLRLIDEAASRGLPEALYSQAETYFYGQFGRNQDYPKAMTLYRASAEAGNVLAQNTLGVMLRDGLATERNEAKAMEWFRKAAEQGDARAQSNLGHLIGVESGDLIKRQEALKWTILAANQNEITAIKTLEELEPNLTARELDAARRAAAEFERKRTAAER